MSDLADFLTQMQEIYVRTVILAGDQRSELSCCISVGCGSAAAPQSSSADLKLVLNNKEIARFGRSYPSVTMLVADPAPGLLENWPLWSERPLAPQAVLDRLSLVVEDASPDSVFSILLLLLRMAGHKIDEVPREWLEAVDSWERDGVADDPFVSWCALFSALTHSRLPAIAQSVETLVAESWTDGLRFAAACLKRGCPPNDIPALSDVSQWRRAHVALQHEERIYVDWLPHATVIQLSVPLGAAPRRRALVDGLVFVEDEITGSTKSFYRNDRVRAPLKDGFALAARYRPSQAGTGNEFTIDVDPRRGIHLGELWEELERRETEAWLASGETRPNNNVRLLEGIDSRWNEPWYLNSEGTLIGAPRRLEPYQRGTRLTWSDVNDAVWTVFNPFIGVKLCPVGSDAPIAFLSLMSQDFQRAGHNNFRHRFNEKWLVMARWPRSMREGWTSVRALSDAPIVSRLLAASINRDPAELKLQILQGPDSWNTISLVGGLAVVTHEGAFVLDDWREQRLNFDPIKSAFAHAAELDLELRTLERDHIWPVIAQFQRLLKVRSVWHPAERVLRSLARIGAELATLRGSHMRSPHDPNAQAVHDALDSQWGLERRLSALEVQVKSVEASLRSLDELRILRVSRFALIFGFPVIFADATKDLTAKLIWPVFAAAGTAEAPQLGSGYAALRAWQSRPG
jgi:hypothetical protein